MSESDLFHHYTVLKQFLDISDDLNARSKSNSNRAVRAREKLFKLSSAQFKELSTDVHDELKRRIDESRGEPDYLLPKSSFHPKRNQARQKLSSLPQSRFKDLVSDISYEIERRGLHVERRSETSARDSRESNNNRELRENARESRENGRESRENGRESRDGNARESRDGNARGSKDARESKDGRDSRDTITRAGSGPLLSSTNSGENRGYHKHNHSQSSNRNFSERSENLTSNRIQEEDEYSQHNITKDSVTSEPNQTIGVQSTTIVPNKANLTWSSDEEDEAGAGFGKSAFVPTVNSVNEKALLDQISTKDSLIDDLKSRLSILQLENESLRSNHNDLQSNHSGLQSNHSDLQSKHTDLQSNHRDLQSNHSELLQEYQSTVAHNKSLGESALELENLRATNSSLRLELQHHKAVAIQQAEEYKSAETQKAEEARIEGVRMIDAEKTANGKLKDANDTSRKSIQKDVQLFLDQLSNLEPRKNANLDLKNDVTKWQKKYEEARSNRLSLELTKILSREEMNSFVSPYGLVSIKLVADLQSLVETFILYLNSETFDSDILFEKISKISILASEIASQGDNQQFNSNEHSIGLREAVSYALTATRYFAVYSAMLPKIVVERSIGEICFSLCDLVSASKLNEKSGNSRNVEPITLEKQRVAPTIGAVPRADDFGARPLRMANRLRESQAQEPVENVRQRDVSGPPVVKVIKHEEKPAAAATTAQSFLKKFSPFGISAPVETDARSPDAPRPVEQASKIPSPKLPSTQSPKIPKGILKSSSNLSLNEVIPERKQSLTKLNIQKIPDKSQIPQPRNFSGESIPGVAVAATATTPVIAAVEAKKESPRGKNIDALASKFETQQDSFVTSSPNGKSTAKSGKRNSILDKVKQFEDSGSPKSPGYLLHSRTSSGDSTNDSVLYNEAPSKTAVRQLSGPFEAIASQNLGQAPKDNINGGVNGKPIPIITAPLEKSKGLFQSIRDRLTSDSEPKVEQQQNNQAEDTTNSEEGLSDNDKGKALSSTAETTPTKDVEVDDQNDFSNAQTEKGFFKSIRDRLTTATDDPAQPRIVSSADSDTTIDLAKRSAELPARSPERVGAIETPIIHKTERLVEAPIQRAAPVQTPIQRAVPVAEPVQVQTPTNPKPAGKSVTYAETDSETETDSEEEESEYESESDEELEARQRQEHRKSIAAASFNVDLFDIDDPDNTLTQVLLYLEHQTVQVILTIQSLLSAIKKPDATRGDLRENSLAITVVIEQMTEATNTSMNQTRNAQLKEHGSWVVRSLEDCQHRMNILCKPTSDRSDGDFADKNFKQRLAGISFDIAKCTKELVKSVEEASLKEDIANLDARIAQGVDLT